MNEIIKILEKTESIINGGHFIGTSGQHMSSYINKDKLISNPKYASKVGREFAAKFKNKKIDVVVAPAVAGISLSQWTAFHLGKMNKRTVYSVYTEKDENNNQIFKRGYDLLIKNKKILIVEDITTLGNSVKKVIKAVKGAKGELIGVCSMVNRNPKNVNSKSLKVPFSSLCQVKIPSYSPKNCPLCKKNIPINTNLGHGRSYVKKNK